MKDLKIFKYFMVLVLLASGLFLASCSESSPEATAIAAGTGLAGIWICIITFAVLIGLGLFVLWIIMLVDCIKRKPEDFPSGNESEKTTWLVILLVSFFVMNLSGIAAIVYYFMVRKKKPID